MLRTALFLLVFVLALEAVLAIPDDVMLMLGFAMVGIGCAAGCVYLLAVVVDDARKEGRDRGWW